MKNRIVEGYFDSDIDELEQKGLLKTMTKDEWEDIKRDCDEIGVTVYGSSIYLGDHEYFMECVSVDNIVIKIDCDFLDETIEDYYEEDVDEGYINPDEVSEGDYWNDAIAGNGHNYEDFMFDYVFMIPDLVQAYKIVD